MIYITCNMGRRDLPDMYALSPRAALGIHIRQVPPVHVTTYTETPFLLHHAKHMSTLHCKQILAMNEATSHYYH